MKKGILLVSSLLLTLVVILTLKQQGSPEWGRYQTDYFKAQVSKLQVELGAVEDSEEKAKLLQAIADYQTRKPEIINLTLPNGKVERCKTCHLGIEEISAAHPSNTFGCSVCHGGNPLSLEKSVAHAQMYGGGHPGSLEVVAQTCGGPGLNGVACHSGNQDQTKNQVDTVKTSIMSTKAGELSIVRQMFGIDKLSEVPALEKGQSAFEFTHPLQGRPHEQAFQQDCLSQCHQSGGELLLHANNAQLKTDKALPTQSTPEQVAETKVQGNGCEACHVLTNPSHSYVGDDITITANQSGRGMVHRLTTQIPYTQCNQCHNQGTHDPLQMTFSVRSDIGSVTRDWQAGDLAWTDRVRDYYLPGEVFARCEVSLDCLDCHTKLDAMGDGKTYFSQHQAVHIQCLDCHGTKEKPPLTKRLEDANEVTVQMQKQLTNPLLPALNRGDEILKSAQGEDMPFLRHQGDEWTLISRVTGKSFKIPLVIDSQCQQNVDQQGADSCHQCHNRTAENP